MWGCSTLGAGSRIANDPDVGIAADPERTVFNALAGAPHPELQTMGVLARARDRVLEGSDVELTPEELRILSTTRRLPASVGEKLGSDRGRTRTLVDSVAALPADWTALVFAASVAQAEIMAGFLALRGVPAAAVSATTDPWARRVLTDQFRRGELRVLTNYGLLTEGFDAPAVRAVYIGRPTFSPNVYQQMVGRGLRGPLNGGKEECLIVDVADNFVQYGGELAFRAFEHLWTA